MYIKQAVNSALAQTYENLEIIVGDDCSSDSTKEIIEEIEDSRLQYIRNKENKGRVANYHSLLYESARGEWILNLDGDDYLLDINFIKNAVDLIESQTVLVFANQCELFEMKELKIDKTGVKHYDKVKFNGKEVLLNYHRNDIYLNHLSTIYKRSEALKVKFYSTDILSSDLESFFRLLPLGHIKFLDTIAGVWRRHLASETHNLNIKKRMENFSLVESVVNFHINQEYLEVDEILDWKKNMILYWCRSNMTVCFDLNGYRGFFKMFSQLLSQYPFETFKSLFNVRVLYRLLVGRVVPYRLVKKTFNL